MIEIPYTKLSTDALRGIILEFVTREGGNNHDQDEFGVDQMIRQVTDQLDDGHVALVYDEETASCTIIHRRDLEEE